MRPILCARQLELLCGFLLSTACLLSSLGPALCQTASDINIPEIQEVIPTTAYPENGTYTITVRGKNLAANGNQLIVDREELVPSCSAPHAGG